MDEETKTVTIPLEELERLKAKNRNQAQQITTLQETLRKKNLELDALHFVWCSGGCTMGVHRFSDVRLTEEMIKIAERNTKRLRAWYNTVKWKLSRYPQLSAWHKASIRGSADKTDLISITDYY